MLGAWLRSLGAWVFPASCACGRPLERSLAAPAPPVPWCRRCAGEVRRAPPCDRPEGVDRLGALYAYAGPVRASLCRAKSGGARHVLESLGASIARAAEDAGLDGLGAVTWAPTTPRARRVRGFDAGEVLARGVGRALDAPVRRLLRRAPGAGRQAGRGRAARVSGPRFRARPGGVPASVLLVDDVVTTGATVGAAAVALRAAGARQVLVVVAAAAPGPGR